MIFFLYLYGIIQTIFTIKYTEFVLQTKDFYVTINQERHSKPTLEKDIKDASIFIAELEDDRYALNIKDTGFTLTVIKGELMVSDIKDEKKLFFKIISLPDGYYFRTENNLCIESENRGLALKKCNSDNKDQLFKTTHPILNTNTFEDLSKRYDVDENINGIVLKQKDAGSLFHDEKSGDLVVDDFQKNFTKLVVLKNKNGFVRLRTEKNMFLTAKNSKAKFEDESKMEDQLFYLLSDGEDEIKILSSEDGNCMTMNDNKQIEFEICANYNQNQKFSVVNYEEEILKTKKAFIFLGLGYGYIGYDTEIKGLVGYNFRENAVEFEFIETAIPETYSIAINPNNKYIQIRKNVAELESETDSFFYLKHVKEDMYMITDNTNCLQFGFEDNKFSFVPCDENNSFQVFEFTDGNEDKYKIDEAVIDKEESFNVDKI